jgi:GTP-binding protein
MLNGMKIRSATFAGGARSLRECPAWSHPEIALIGRSNVGKSSLVNFLLNQRALAKVSSTPGKTREVNFFLVDGAWVLTDLPGYGYAKTSRGEKSLFNELAGDYLERRENLRHVLVLIDSRLPPQRIDLDFCAWLATTGRVFSLVFTKADKQSPAKTGASVALFQEAVHPLVGELPECIACSSAKRSGREDVLALVGAALLR